MNEFRRDIPLSTESQYWFVEMGPIPNMPDWHTELYAYQAYPFPSLEAARRFAFDARERDWKRSIAIRFPDDTKEIVPHV